MKNFTGLNYYEILKTPTNSSFIAIKRAYREALAVYEEDSTATYSLFTKEERDSLLSTIEEAFLTLSDESKKAAYNRRLIETGEVDASIFSKKYQKKAILLSNTDNSAITKKTYARVRKGSVKDEMQHLLREVLAKDLISGSDLKGLRKAFGIKASEIYAITNINVPMLRMIEDDQFDDLPANIYLKSFIKSYAKILQIDPEHVAKGYLENKLQNSKSD